MVLRWETYPNGFVKLTKRQIDKNIAESGRWHLNGVALNALVFLSVLIAVSLLNEIRVRRRLPAEPPEIPSKPCP